MLVFRVLTAFCVLLVSAGLAFAAPVCYSDSEFEAEQAVSFQMELMVVSDTCKTGVYQPFLIRNQRALAAYQSELMEHYRRIGDRHPETVLDSYETRMANDVSMHIGSMPLASFCGTQSELFANAGTLTPASFPTFVKQRVVEHKREFVPCR
jgi:hypothetical protein